MISMNLKWLQSQAKPNLECTNLYVLEGFSHDNGFDEKKISQKLINVKKICITQYYNTTAHWENKSIFWGFSYIQFSRKIQNIVNCWIKQILGKSEQQSLNILSMRRQLHIDSTFVQKTVLEYFRQKNQQLVVSNIILILKVYGIKQLEHVCQQGVVKLLTMHCPILYYPKI